MILDKLIEVFLYAILLYHLQRNLLIAIWDFFAFKSLCLLMQYGRYKSKKNNTSLII